MVGGHATKTSRPSRGGLGSCATEMSGPSHGVSLPQVSLLCRHAPRGRALRPPLPPTSGGGGDGGR